MLKNKAEAVNLEQEKRQVKSEDSADSLVKDWETRLKAEPNNLKMLRNLAEVYAQRNEFDKALGFYERIAATDGGSDSSLMTQITDLKTKKFNHALAQLDTTAEDYADKAAAIKADRQAFQIEAGKQPVDRYPTDL